MALRHRQALSIEELRAEAVSLFEQYQEKTRQEQGKKISQDEFAAELGISRGLLSRALSESGAPSIDTLKKIIETLSAYTFEEVTLPPVYRIFRRHA